MEPKKNPAKDVHRYSSHFFFIGLAISVSAVIMAFEWRSVKKSSGCHLPSPNEFTGIVYDPTIVIMPEQKTATPHLKRVQVIDPNRIIAVQDDPLLIDTTLFVMVEPEGLTNPITIEIAPEPIVHDTFFIAEKMPLPVGGYEGFYTKLGRNLRYPKTAQRRNIEGKVFVEFVINKNGDPVNLRIVSGIGFGCDDEAMRVVAMTKWEPGKQRGNPVNVKMTLPVYFKLY